VCDGPDHLTQLVFTEFHDDIRDAIARESGSSKIRFKHWPWMWNLNLIEEQNPLWEDLLDRWNQ